MQKIHSFRPIIDQNSQVLILGSMPGKVSLEKEEYYAHPRNKFWAYVYSVFNTPQDVDYEVKKVFLKSRKIALWDVIKECRRSGSSDSKIVGPVINDFNKLLAQFPNIKSILFNGKTAEQIFKTHLPDLSSSIHLFTLPSSSPANAGITQSEKLKAWRIIKDLVAK